MKPKILARENAKKLERSSDDGVIYIPEGITVVLSESIKIVQEEAFGLCKNLKSINLPNTNIRIGIDAFMGCSSLELHLSYEFAQNTMRNLFGLEKIMLE